MLYTTFDFYETDYGGGPVPEDAFSRLALRASEHIDRLTKGRAGAYFLKTPHPISMAACAVLEILHQAECANPRHIQVEIAGASHLTYFAPPTAEALDADIARAVHRFLARTGLLFRGVS